MPAETDRQMKGRMG